MEISLDTVFSRLPEPSLDIRLHVFTTPRAYLTMQKRYVGNLGRAQENARTQYVMNNCLHQIDSFLCQISAHTPQYPPVHKTAIPHWGGITVRWAPFSPGGH